MAAIAAAVAWQLLVPPLIGLADNGDFPRIMSRFDIGYLSDKYEERYFGYFLRQYRIDKKDHWDSDFVSSQTLLVALALPINKLLSKPGFFDIRAVAVVHLVLELAAAWLLLTYSPVNGRIAGVVLLGIVILALTDVGYVSYFNSFYSEPGSFVFLLLTLGVILVTLKRPTGGALFGFCVAGILFVTSKPQNVAPGIILAAYSLRFCSLRPGQGWRWACAGAASCLFAGSIYYFSLKPPDIITKPSYYLSVFYEILRYSPDPRRDLIELGLDADLAKYAGTRPWSPGSPKDDPDFQRSFFDKMSFSKVIRFHLMHPVRLLGTLDRVARYAPQLRPDTDITVDSVTTVRTLGNYEKVAGLPPWTQSHSFDLWSRLRQACSPGSLKSFALFFGVNCAGIALLYPRRGTPTDRLLLELQGALLLMAILQFGSVAVAQGTHEAAKHLFLFDLLVDICFGIAVIYGWRVAHNAIYGERR
jgi:hypothetical protein